MKRILFHSLTIPPDNVSTGMLVAELAAGFNENNIKVEEVLKNLEGYFSGCDFIITRYVFYTRQEKLTNISLFLAIRQQ